MMVAAPSLARVNTSNKLIYHLSTPRTSGGVSGVSWPGKSVNVEGVWPRYDLGFHLINQTMSILIQLTAIKLTPEDSNRYQGKH